MHQDESQYTNAENEQDNRGGAAPEHRRCRYSKADGKTCRDWAVRGQEFCYRHGVFVHGGRGIDVPLLEDEASIVLVLSETLRAVACGKLPVNHGRLLIDGCRLAHSMQMERLKAAGHRVHRTRTPEEEIEVQETGTERQETGARRQEKAGAGQTATAPSSAPCDLKPVPCDEPCALSPEPCTAPCDLKPVPCSDPCALSPEPFTAPGSRCPEPGAPRSVPCALSSEPCTEPCALKPVPCDEPGSRCPEPGAQRSAPCDLSSEPCTDPGAQPSESLAASAMPLEEEMEEEALLVG